MPNAIDILASLHEIANQWQILATFWHLYFVGLALLFLLNVRLSRRVAAVFLALPLASVSILAWMYANPFNGTLFAVAALALFGIGFTLRTGQLRVGSSWSISAGAALLIFGWVYPHFLQTATFLQYLYAAPLGLLPCPTLSAVIGTGLILRGLDSLAWSGVLAATGVFYGLLGAIFLDVHIDWLLFVGSSVFLGFMIYGSSRKERVST